MVAPSAFSKDSSAQSGPGIVSLNQLKKVEKPSTEDKADKGKGDPTRFVSIITKASRKLGQGIIMNPVVLSIINFPNKCIFKKSEKYVVNGLTLPPSSGKLDNTVSMKNNNNNSVPTGLSASSCKKQSFSKYKRYGGLVLAIMSSMMFSFTGLIVKILPHHHALTQATWMFVGTTIVAIILNLFKYTCSFLSKSSDGNSAITDCESQNIEPIKVIETLSEYTMDATSIAVISEKLNVGLPFPPTSDVELILKSNPSLIAKRQQAERRRKMKLYFLLLVRACSGCSGMILYFYSLMYLNVGDSLVIVCSSPIFVFIIGYLFLGEKCGVIPVLTIVLSMLGVMVITRPPMLTGAGTFQTDEIIGAGLAFSSMLCIAITIIMMRFLQNVYHGVINLVFGVWGTIQTFTLAMALQVFEFPQTLPDALLMSTTGVLFFLGQTFLAVSLQLEEAGPVALVRTSEVVFAFVWQFIFLRVAPDIFSISGAGLILTGIFLTISRKWIAAMPEDSTARRLFSFLLR